MTHISNAYRKHEGIKILDSISYKKTKQALKAYKYCNRLSEWKSFFNKITLVL